MRTLIVAAGAAVLSAGLGAVRGFVDQPTAQDQPRRSETVANIDLMVNPKVDLKMYNARPVGWVVGQLCGVETPSLAPSRKASYRRLDQQ